MRNDLFVDSDVMLSCSNAGSVFTNYCLEGVQLYTHRHRHTHTHTRLYCYIQWNPYIADTIGELHVGRYRGPAVVERFYKYYMNEIRTLALAVIYPMAAIQGWPLSEVPL